MHGNSKKYQALDKISRTEVQDPVTKFGKVAQGAEVPVQVQRH
jgi:hypothetical protein